MQQHHSFNPAPFPHQVLKSYWANITLLGRAHTGHLKPLHCMHACYLLFLLALVTITVCSINKDSCEVFIPCTGARWSILCVFLQNPHGLCYSIYQMGTWRIICLWVYSKNHSCEQLVSICMLFLFQRKMSVVWTSSSSTWSTLPWECITSWREV